MQCRFFTRFFRKQTERRFIMIQNAIEHALHQFAGGFLGGRWLCVDDFG